MSLVQIKQSLPLLSSPSAQKRVVAAESFQPIGGGTAIPVVMGIVNQTSKIYENTDSTIVNFIGEACKDLVTTNSPTVLCYNPWANNQGNCLDKVLMRPGVSTYATGTSKKTNSSLTLEIVTLAEFSGSPFFQCLNQTAGASAQQAIDHLDNSDGGAFVSKAASFASINKKAVFVAVMLGVSALFSQA